MSFLPSDSIDVSPVQHHTAQVCTEIFWATGEMETLGSPHHYVNQEELAYLQLNEAHLTPWQYTGLPASRPAEVIVRRENTYLIYFTDAETNELYKKPPKTIDVVFFFSLFIVQAQAPLLSEAKFSNFMDFRKGMFLPVSDASIHFLVGGPSNLPSRAPLLYMNRQHLQGYVRP